MIKINNILNNALGILLISLVILAIFLVLWIIYSIVWAAYFVPINKKLKYDEKLKKQHDEKFRLETGMDKIEEEIDVLRKQYSDQAIKNNETELELQRKQKLLKSYDDEMVEFKKWKEAGSPVVIETAETEVMKEKDIIAKELDKKIDAEVEKEIQEKEASKTKPKQSKSTAKKTK